MGEIVASRVLNTLYMYLDIGFLLFLAVTLLVLKRYTAAIFGFLGGLLYFAVDYGIFYQLLAPAPSSGPIPSGSCSG